MIPLLAFLSACPKPAAEVGPKLPSELIPAEEARVAPLPPPAPVDVVFAWPDGSACLMATRRTETLATPMADISTLTGVGSGVLSAWKEADERWTVAFEDRSGTARHLPLDADLLTAMERIQLGLRPTLTVSADGRTVQQVTGLDGVYEAYRRELDALAAGYSTVGQALWLEAMPGLLSPEALGRSWRESWADGWGFAFGRSWVAGQPVELVASSGEPMVLTYRDVVPCKFNEDEPLCVRIQIDLPPGQPTTPEARLRVALPPGADAEAEAAEGKLDRAGELVVEVATGLPWRWTLLESERHLFTHGETEHELLVRRKQDVSCDWRVAE